MHHTIKNARNIIIIENIIYVAISTAFHSCSVPNKQRLAHVTDRRRHQLRAHSWPVFRSQRIKYEYLRVYIPTFLFNVYLRDCDCENLLGEALNCVMRTGRDCLEQGPTTIKIVSTLHNGISFMGAIGATSSLYRYVLLHSSAIKCVNCVRLHASNSMSHAQFFEAARLHNKSLRPSVSARPAVSIVQSRGRPVGQALAEIIMRRAS